MVLATPNLAFGVSDHRACALELETQIDIHILTPRVFWSREEFQVLSKTANYPALESTKSAPDLNNTTPTCQ